MFNAKFPNVTNVKLPIQLKSISRVSMSQLICQLDKFQNVDIGDDHPNYVYGMIGIKLVSLIILDIWVYCKRGEKCSNQLRARKSNKQKQLIVTSGYQYHMVPTASGETDRNGMNSCTYMQGWDKYCKTVIFQWKKP